MGPYFTLYCLKLYPDCGLARNLLRR